MARRDHHGPSARGERNPIRLKDKVAIVTGAASGIGAATAVVLAHEGAKVVAADITVLKFVMSADSITSM